MRSRKSGHTVQMVLFACLLPTHVCIYITCSLLAKLLTFLRTSSWFCLCNRYLVEALIQSNLVVPLSLFVYLLFTCFKKKHLFTSLLVYIIDWSFTCLHACYPLVHLTRICLPPSFLGYIIIYV